LESGNLEEHEGDRMILRLILGKYAMRMEGGWKRLRVGFYVESSGYTCRQSSLAFKKPKL
jgi:hypothetical protein